MAASECPKCGKTEFEIKPTFLPAETIFGRHEVKNTFSLNVQCKSCQEVYKVIDHNNVMSIDYLLKKVNELEEMIKTIAKKG